MKCVIAGKKETYTKYLKKNNLKDFEEVFYATSTSSLALLNEESTIILLAGWFAKSWAKQFIKEAKILYPSISFEYLDGKIGESERNNLKSDNIYSRFDMLDL